MPHEDQFTATGPAFSGAGFPDAAFSTNRVLSNMTYGVNVQGSACGVLGASLKPSDMDRAAPEPNTGVCGLGNGFGVYGAGNTTVGVYGETGYGVSGVYGKGLKTGSAGVVGISKVKSPVPDSSSPSGYRYENMEEVGGTGVIGAANGGKGFGVIGLSVKKIFDDTNRTPIPEVGYNKPGENGQLSSFQDLDNGTGVLGMSGLGEGVLGMSEKGTGVWGSSKEGAGVAGQSATGRGGVFGSGKFRAQVHLVPDKQEGPTPVLPKDGKVGDLILIHNTFRIDVPKDANPVVDVCSLWLCIPQAGVGGHNSNTWRKIELGSTVIGTGIPPTT